MRLAIRSLPACVLALTVLVPAASATTMRRLDTRQLTIGSSEIVIGTVESARPRWSDDRKRIVTDVVVRVSRSLKGLAGERITLSQLGGELDGVRYSIPGAPAFRPGEESLVFVWTDARGLRQVNGLAQGKFDIARDAASGEATVQRTVPGFAVKDPRKLEVLDASRPAPRVPLRELVREIERALAETGDGGGR